MIEKLSKLFQTALLSLLLKENIISEKSHGTIIIGIREGRIIKFNADLSLELE